MPPEKHPVLLFVARTLLTLAVTVRLDLPDLLTTGEHNFTSSEQKFSCFYWATKGTDTRLPSWRTMAIYELPSVKSYQPSKTSDYHHIWVEEDTTARKIEVRI